jgi:hypothetical protein
LHAPALAPLEAPAGPAIERYSALRKMAGDQPPSPEFLAETNDPFLDQRVSIAFIVLDTFFLIVFYVSRYYNKQAVGLPMLVCNTLAYVLCLGSAATGICRSLLIPLQL